VYLTMSSNEAEKSIEDTLAALGELLRNRKNALDEREKELQEATEAFEREKAVFGASSGDGKKKNDVLYLNIGGNVVNVLRRTLTSVEGSMLASLFSGRWDDNIEKDADGNFFIDQSPKSSCP